MVNLSTRVQMAIRGLLAQDFNLLFSVAKHRSLGLGYDSARAKHVEVAAFFWEHGLDDARWPTEGL